ncbi:hypothetical protein GLOIN_2v1484278 [Rhizophagus irregularis DAOM 181602=DAOM 197198]|nr:hypothetical protein GLOIN_2v1484278 [Rhizophagus irregularis DAOM 181602=DAOM 197198]
MAYIVFQEIFLDEIYKGNVERTPTRKVLKETQKTSNATTDNSGRKVSEADKIALKLGPNSISLIIELFY